MNDIFKNSYAGIYIHIPFCIRKCPYCGFYSETDFSYIDDFCEALEKEISLAADKSLICDSVYFGGGTPPLIGRRNLSQILSHIFKNFTILPDSEITIEANPSSIDKDFLLFLKKAGFNRINIGIQSFSDSKLKFLGRVHDCQKALFSYYEAREAGFDNVGIDLICGTRQESLKAWRKDIQKAVEIKPEHISCYMLSIEKGTEFEKRLNAGILKKPKDEILKKFFLSTIEELKRAGFLHYEISNFAKNDHFKSRHNLKYWAGNKYIGFGPSAHSFDKEARQWNISDTKKYIFQINAGKSVIEEKEILDKNQKILEALYLGFRTSEGINIKKFNLRFKTDFIKNCKNIISQLKDKNMLDIKRGFCHLTPQGMILLDSIVLKFSSIYDYYEIS